LSKRIENLLFWTLSGDLKGGAHDPVTFDPFKLDGSRHLPAEMTQHIVHYDHVLQGSMHKLQRARGEWKEGERPRQSGGEGFPAA
jgi:hypothetical protein